MLKKIIYATAIFATILPTISFACTNFSSDFFSAGTPSTNFGTNQANAIDGNLATGWDAYNNALPNWWKIDTTTNHILAKISIAPYGDANGRQIEGFYIEGSTDNSNWTNFYSYTLPNQTSNVYTDLELTTSTNAYRYFKFTVTDPTYYVPNPHVGGSIQEIQGYTCTDSTSTQSTSSLLMSSTTDAIVGNTFQLGYTILIGLIFLGTFYIIFKIVKK